MLMSTATVHVKYMVAIIYHSLGKVHGSNISCEKIHVKIFSSWIKYSHFLPYLANGINISCVKFSSQQAADENFLTVNFSQTTVVTILQYTVHILVHILQYTVPTCWAVGISDTMLLFFEHDGLMEITLCLTIDLQLHM